MRMNNDYANKPAGTITGDEALLAKIEGVDLSDVVVPDSLALRSADNVATAYSKAKSQPHTSTGEGDDVVVHTNENIKIYAVVKNRYLGVE